MTIINSSLASQTLTELNPIIENLLLLLSDKEKVVIKKRFNLDNSRKFTLEEIGKEFSVTRERIRQIEKNALIKMKRNVFNSSLKHLHDYISVVIRDHGGLIKEDNIHEFLINNLVSTNPNVNRGALQLSLALHEDLECIGNTINFYPYIKYKNISDFSIKHASDQIVQHLQKYGDVKELNKLYEDFNNFLKEIDFDLQRTKALISIDKRMTLLENNKVGLMEWRHIHPRTLRDKILFVLRNENKPLHFTFITEKISNANFDNRPVNLQAVHNELIRHDQFVLIGRGIYALKEWGYEKGTVAEVILNILKDYKELDQEEIIEKVLKQRHVKRITIILALKNNQYFERIGRKRYKLKGN